MKILHIITGLNLGGAEHMLYKLLGGINRNRYKPYVISLTPGGIYAEKIAALGVPVYDLGMQTGIPNPASILHLRKLTRQINPHIIHCWLYHASLLALIALKDPPVILGIRSALSNIGQEKFLTRQVITGLGRVSRRAALICYNSEVSRRQHEAIGYDGSRSLVIDNGFDCTLYQPIEAVRLTLRAQMGLPSDAFVVGHLGRYHPVKNHQGLITAFALLAASHPNARLIIAGSRIEPENTELTKVIKTFHLEGKIQLIGECNHVPQLINAFDVLANASLSEAFPNVLGEAMACAVPCVASDAGDSAYVIGKAGFVTPLNDNQAMAAALARVANMKITERRTLGAQARARILENFSLLKIVQDYEKTYDQISTKSKVHEKTRVVG